MRNLHNEDTMVSVENFRRLAKEEPVTLLERIKYSGITTDEVCAKLIYLYETRLPERDVYLKMDDEELARAWFSNWLMPKVERFLALPPAPKLAAPTEHHEWYNELKSYYGIVNSRSLSVEDFEKIKIWCYYKSAPNLKQIVLSTCSKCPHLGHKSAFETPAYVPCCRKKQNKPLPYTTVVRSIRIVAQLVPGIPAWCPLDDYEG